MRRLIGPLGLALAVAACDSATSVACTDQFVYGITVEVTSQADASPVTAGLAGTLTDGAYTEEMQRFENVLEGAGERAGTYTLTITAEGFQPLQQAGLVVEQGECHVIPRSLGARLVPLP